MSLWQHLARKKSFERPSRHGSSGGESGQSVQEEPIVLVCYPGRVFFLSVQSKPSSKSRSLGWGVRHSFEFEKKAPSSSLGAPRQAMNHRRHGLWGHEIPFLTNPSHPSSQESPSRGPCVVVHAILRCTGPLATKAGAFPVCRKGFGAKASRSTRSHHAGEAYATSSKESHHQ